MASVQTIHHLAHTSGPMGDVTTSKSHIQLGHTAARAGQATDVHRRARKCLLVLLQLYIPGAKSLLMGFHEVSWRYIHTHTENVGFGFSARSKP